MVWGKKWLRGREHLMKKNVQEEKGLEGSQISLTLQVSIGQALLTTILFSVLTTIFSVPPQNAMLPSLTSWIQSKSIPAKLESNILQHNVDFTTWLAQGLCRPLHRSFIQKWQGALYPVYILLYFFQLVERKVEMAGWLENRARARNRI